MNLPNILIQIQKYLSQKSFKYSLNKGHSDDKAALAKNCQRALKEASYIKSLSYWPIAKTGILTKPEDLVDLKSQKIIPRPLKIRKINNNNAIVSVFELKLKKR